MNLYKNLLQECACRTKLYVKLFPSFLVDKLAKMSTGCFVDSWAGCDVLPHTFAAPVENLHGTMGIRCCQCHIPADQSKIPDSIQHLLTLAYP